MAQLKSMVSKFDSMLGTLVAAALILFPFADARALTVDESTELPAQQKALVFARVLADEKQLVDRAGDVYTLAILSRQGKAASESCAREMTSGFELLQAKKIGGIPLRFIAQTLASPTGIIKLDDAQNLDAVYLCNGFNAGEVQALTTLATERKIITLADSYSYLKSGAVMGLFVVEGKPRIIWSTPAMGKLALTFGPTATRYALPYSE